MTLHLPIRGVLSLRPGVALFCLLAPLSLHTNVFAQDVAAAARQEQAEKSQQPVTPRHVYTEDDLKRAHILTPEDQKLAEARRKDSTAPEQAAAPAPAESAPRPESLGEIARRYRREKAVRESELSAKKKTPSQFKFELPAAALAEPKPFVAGSPASHHVSPAPGLPPLGNPRRSAAPARVSPFQPRPSLATPMSPALRLDSSALMAGRNLQQHRVQPGETLWRMARHYLGNGSRWREILSLNPGLAAHPDSLAAGSTVIVPGAIKSAPARDGSATITVQSGDTLWSLAHAHLGRGHNWPALAQANPQLSDYLHLQVGSKLHLPPE
jgi:nucleoid-associated protein YgaU